ncbi:myb-like domain, Myb/SANT-like DNA-binding domain protein [Artemisia annua]|uniref:Myb-like domain, Myb/SANT-like DNA-binding domain protein n=1 Tax=Artemisia annua TaxID=35608 RepID=A0A2U1NFP8_ARTAN|nr:myb-like domain, Myb/SANT-like DNA-binding domain protein [Artemisia annua]
MYSKSQPGYESSPPQPGYRPQMYPQSPPFFYNQQPLPQLPTNFDARDRVSEPLPIHDYNEDDEFFDNVDVIPETQPIDEDAEQVHEEEEVEENWTPDEEEALAKAWIKISVDRDVGDRQKKEGFWGRVTKHFKTLVPRTQRTHHQLNSKWTPMHQMIQAFNGYYIQAKRLKASGCDDLQASESTGSSKKRKSSESSSAQTPTNETPINVEDFDLPNLNENPTPTRQPRGKKKVDSGDTSRSSMRDTLASYAAEKKSLLQSKESFRAYQSVAHSQRSKKWQEQPLVGQASESTGSSKKRKSSESSSAQTLTNETPINVEDFDLPNLNENPTPTRQPRGKKKVDSGDTSRSSMRDTLASYAAEKKSLLQSQLRDNKPQRLEQKLLLLKFEVDASTETPL